MIKISKEAIGKIELHGKKTYPEECCGVMLGRSDGDRQTVYDIVEFDNNQDENRRRRFFVTPKQYLQAERLASENSLELLGFYHSHPDHPAIPSEYDRDHALPWFTYVIVSIMDREAKGIAAWLLSEDRSHFNEREMLVHDSGKMSLERTLTLATEQQDNFNKYKEIGASSKVGD